MNALTLNRAARSVPDEFRATFFHLYLDIAWFGVVSGSVISFITIYATRLGAAGWQLGLLAASPALIGLLLTLPSGRWLENRPVGPAVFWTSVLHRLGYLPWVFLPLLFNAQSQIWAIIVTTLLMSIPGTGLAVGFNAMFAAAVPAEWRGQVVGTRNALLALTFIGTSLLCGWLLSWLPFPLGYQVVFGIGFLGAAMSSLHLWLVKNNLTESPPSGNGRMTGDLARPGLTRPGGDGLRTFVGLRFLTRSKGRPFLNLHLLQGRYGRLILLLFTFHLAQFLANPLFAPYWVRNLDFNDQQISLGTALFYVTVFLGSTQLKNLSGRLGHFKVTVIGMLAMSLYPFLTGLTVDLTLFLIASAAGGLAWALAGGAMGNYLLERIPEDDRPAHLALYHLALNAAVLLGSLGGPLLADLTGLVTALFLAAVFRLFAALAIWRWGGFGV